MIERNLVMDADGEGGRGGRTFHRGFEEVDVFMKNTQSSAHLVARLPRPSDLTVLCRPSTRLRPLHFPLFLPIRLIADENGDQVLAAERARILEPPR